MGVLCVRRWATLDAAEGGPGSEQVVQRKGVECSPWRVLTASFAVEKHASASLQPASAKEKRSGARVRHHLSLYFLVHSRLDTTNTLQIFLYYANARLQPAANVARHVVQTTTRVRASGAGALHVLTARLQRLKHNPHVAFPREHSRRHALCVPLFAPARVADRCHSRIGSP